jgi:hypothetical protein
MKICGKCKISKEFCFFYKRRSVCIDCNPNDDILIKSKICSKCSLYKDISDFNKDDRSQDGLCASCKECFKIYRGLNKDRAREYMKEYVILNKDILSEKRSYYREENREKAREYHRNYKKVNRKKINKYYSDRKKNDSFFKFKLSVRNLLYNSFKRGFSVKCKRTTEILGCSFEEFRTHIESKFNENMCWDNYGPYWEFDHIIQLATSKSEEDLLKLNHYTNFQPLEVEKNRSKNFKY